MTLFPLTWPWAVLSVSLAQVVPLLFGSTVSGKHNLGSQSAQVFSGVSLDTIIELEEEIYEYTCMQYVVQPQKQAIKSCDQLVSFCF